MDEDKKIIAELKIENKKLKKEILSLNKTIENIKKILKERVTEAKNLFLKRKVK
jgi:hypothetical protein